ncbi:MAG: hypothetical protein E6H57_13160, partial [Betaproteobacteria bacterium]
MLPHRADHIGSLLRPKKLREAFRAHSEKRLGDAELRVAQDEAIRDVVRLQEDCGLQVVTDGEFRRISYWEKFVRLTAGLEVRNAVFKFHDQQGHESDFTAPFAHAKVSRRAPITVDEFRFVKQHSARLGKITMPAPSTLLCRSGQGLSGGARRARRRRLPLRAARRGGGRHPLRPGSARQGKSGGRGSRSPRRSLYRRDQPGREEPAQRHGHRR